MFQKWLLCLIMLCAGNSAVATLNVEKFRSGRFTTEGWKIGADLGVDFSSGNAVFTRFQTSGTVRYLTLFDPESKNPEAKSFYFVTADFQTLRNQDADEILNETSTVHARWTQMFVPLIGSELFAQVQYNRLWNVNARVLLGAGPRVKVVKKTRYSVFVGAAAMLEYELLNEAVTSFDRARFYARGSSYVALQLDVFPEKMNWTFTSYYQPLLNDFSDFRLLIDTEVEVILSERFSFAVQFRGQRDTVPAPGIEPNDLRLMNKLRFNI
jgi:hypothetical protein